MVVSIPLLYVGYQILSYAFEIYLSGDTNSAIFYSIFGFILVGFAIFYIKKNKWVLERKLGFKLNFRKIRHDFRKIKQKLREIRYKHGKKLTIMALAIIGVFLLWHFFIAESSDLFGERNIFDFSSKNKLTELKTAEIVCNKPYIRFETSCCLDQNDNKICDNHEISSEAINVKEPEVVKSPFYNDFLRTEARKLHCGQPRHEARELLYPIKYTVSGHSGTIDNYVHEGNTLVVYYSGDKYQILMIENNYGDGSDKPSYQKKCPGLN